jgi:hypothetical protein
MNLLFKKLLLLLNRKFHICIHSYNIVLVIVLKKPTKRILNTFNTKVVISLISKLNGIMHYFSNFKTELKIKKY